MTALLSSFRDRATYGGALCGALAAARRCAIIAVLVAIVTSCGDGVSPIQPALPPLVRTVVVRPESATVVVGAMAQLTASALDSRHRPVSGRAVVWSSRDSSIVSMSASGMAYGLVPGRATVIATIDAMHDSAVVIVTASAWDIAFVDAQFTQAVQANDNSIPIVLGGNAAVVNVLLRATPAAQGPARVVLRLFNAAGTLVRADTAVWLTPAVVDSASYLAPDIQFRLPASVLGPGMRWQLVRDPAGLAPDDSAANDVLPRQGTAALATIAVPPLRIRFMPVVLTAHDNVTGLVSSAALSVYMQTIESIFPLGAIDVAVGAPFASDESFVPVDFDGDHIGAILGQLDLARLVDPDPSTYVIGVVQAPTDYRWWTNGMGYIPLSGQAIGPGTRTAVFTSNDVFSDAQFTRIVAHELGHNFGRYHSPCGGAQGPDPSYPYSGGVVGVPGHDVRSWAVGRTTQALALAPTLGDVMGYCSPSWISDYTYQRIAAFRGERSLAIAATQRATRVLIVRGTVIEGGGVTLAPVLTLHARAARPERTGRYHLVGRSAGGRVLFARDFEPSTIDHAPGRGHFTFAIPVTAEMEAALATISVVGPAGTAQIDAAPPGAAAAAAPAARPVQRAAGGLVSVSCASPAARAALLLDARTGAVLGAATGATARGIPSAGTPLTLVCSDGLRTTRAPVVAP
ncbi:MAG TPA: Ig-like domain-containing protein [Gemmatimonadales bacterium]